MKLHRLMGNTGYTTFGCMWEKGICDQNYDYVCRNFDGESIPIQSRITALWPDGSVKWTAHTADSLKCGKDIVVMPVDAPDTVSVTDKEDGTEGKRAAKDGKTVEHVAEDGKIVEHVAKDGKIVEHVAEDGKIVEHVAEDGSDDKCVATIGTAGGRNTETGSTDKPVLHPGMTEGLSLIKQDDGFCVLNGQMIIKIPFSGDCLISEVFDYSSDTIHNAVSDTPECPNVSEYTNGSEHSNASEHPNTSEHANASEYANVSERANASEHPDSSECTNAAGQNSKGPADLRMVARRFRPELILTDPTSINGNPAWEERHFSGRIDNVTVEEEGPLMCAFRFDGTHTDKTGVERLRFVIRLKVFYNSRELKFTHTFIYDGEPEKDYLKALSVVFEMPACGEMYNRHIKFATDHGTFHESAMTMISWRPRVPKGLHAAQMRGELLKPVGDELAAVNKIMEDIPFWDTYDLCQDSDSHFEIRKKLEGGDLCYIDALNGNRAKGAAFVGTAAGGVMFAIRDFWEKYPSGFTIEGLTQDNITVRMHLWSPGARPFDFRHYARRGYNQVCYEGYDYKGADPYGIACTNELSVKFIPIEQYENDDTAVERTILSEDKMVSVGGGHSDQNSGIRATGGRCSNPISGLRATDGRSRDPIYRICVTDAELLQYASDVNTTTLYVGDPEYYHDLRAFGYWSLVKDARSAGIDAASQSEMRDNKSATELQKKLEKDLARCFEFYKNEVEQRKWYGMFNYGDFMHTYDPDRHVWRYDVGGYAWDNTELVPTLWLWYYFMRTGRADVFRLAEKLTRHTSEVDVYHIGKYKGMGSRHNVIHWGCPCKEARIAMAGHHRFYYYLTGDRRLEDIFDELKDNEETFLNRDPLGDFYPKEAMIEPSHARSGPDWSSLCSNWMTQWERTGDTKYRDKIMVGTEDIENAPLKLVSGPDFEFNPTTLHLRYIGERTTGGTHLQICMGAPQIWTEMADLLDDDEWRNMLAQYGRFYFLPDDEKQKESNGLIGDRQFTIPMFACGIGAYGAARLNDEELAGRVIKTLLDAQYKDCDAEGFVAHTVKDAGNNGELAEIPWISTNHAAQFCLNAIMVMEFLEMK